MRSQYCNYNRETTCAAHSEDRRHGKGAGRKADDCFVSYLCSGCHDYYDNRVISHVPRAIRQREFDRAMEQTWLIVVKEGILK
jgi:hypothetical protein